MSAIVGIYLMYIIFLFYGLTNGVEQSSS